MTLLLPILSVKWFYRDLRNSRGLEAPNVDTVPIWIGPGNVKRLDAAGCAKQMFRDAGVECVGSEISRALQQEEP